MWGKFIKAVFKREHRISALTIFAAIATVVYTIWPADLIPELVFPVVGYIDDLGLWGVLGLLLTREKKRWESGLREGAIDGQIRDK